MHCVAGCVEYESCFSYSHVIYMTCRVVDVRLTLATTNTSNGQLMAKENMGQVFYNGQVNEV